MIDKHKLFPPNELYEFKLDSPTISKVEYKIERVELAKKYAKKTTRRHQINKKLIRLESELKHTILKYNEFDLFNAISEKLDIVIGLDLEKQFENFAYVSDFEIEDKF